MVRRFVPINGIKAPTEIQEACVKQTSQKFSMIGGRVKDIIKKNIYHLLERDTIVGTSPSKKPRRVNFSSFDCFSHSTRPLYDHQMRVAKSLEHNRSLIIVHSVGSGKTLTAVSSAHCFLENNPSMIVIIVTPPSLVDNFKEEILRSFNNANISRYVFYTHAKFAKDLKHHLIAPEVIQNAMVIIDEIHNYRGKIPKSVNGKKKKSSKKKKKVTRIPACYYVQQGLKKAQRILGLTATPFVNDISDLITIVSIVTGKDLYAIRGKSEFDILMENSNNVFSFYEIEKGDPRFPSYTIHKIELVMPKEYYKRYMEIEKYESKHVRKSFSEAFYGNIRVASNKIDNSTSSPKVLWTINKVNDIVQGGGKVVVFSSFVDSGIKLIESELMKKGIECSFITGKVKRSERKGIVEKYNTRQTKVLLISKAGGEGLDLKETSAVIMLEPTWNGASRTQVFGRGIRNGSHLDLPETLRHVDCYILLMVKPKMNKFQLPSGDKRIYDITEDKNVVAEAILKQLEIISIEKKVLTRWIATKQNYHILPIETTNKGSGGYVKELYGPYHQGEDDDVTLSTRSEKILAEIEDYKKTDTLSSSSDDNLTFYNSDDEESSFYLSSNSSDDTFSLDEDSFLLNDDDFII